MKGVGSLVVGGLLNSSIELADIWLVFAGAGSAVSLVALAAYHTFGKRFEKRLVQEKMELMAKAGLKKGQDSPLDMSEAKEEVEPKASDDGKGDDAASTQSGSTTITAKDEF